MNDPREFINMQKDNKIVPENNISLYLKTGLTDEYWRMHYAGLAMQANLMSGNYRQQTYGIMSEHAFICADAMIKASKEKE
jgi:hypothetical protein